MRGSWGAQGGSLGEETVPLSGPLGVLSSVAPTRGSRSNSLGLDFSNSRLPSLPQPPAPSSPTGHASLLGHRTSQCRCTKMPSWSAWPRAIPDPSSPGAVQTASLLMFTTLKCWEMATSSSQTSSPSMEACTCAEPPPLERETIP